MKAKPPKPLRLLVLSAKGWGTGSALRAFYIAEALKKRGHEVEFIKPLPTMPLWLDMALSKTYYFVLSLFITSDVAFCVKPYPTVVPALWIQRLKGAKIVFDVDDLDYAYSRGPFKRFHQWLQKPWPKWADLVTYHNPKLKGPIRDFFEVPAEKLLQVPQGVDLSLFHPGPNIAEDLPPETAEWIAHQTSCVLFTFTAHLNVACDLKPVLDAFGLLLDHKPNARLLIAGGGPDQPLFEAHAEKLGISGFLRFTGPLTPRQVAACLKASDAALAYYGPSPANEHRASMKLREALACGCRVLATAVGEAPSFKSAVFLSKPDPDSFAKAMLSVLKAKKPPRASALLVKKWDWSRCVEGLEARFSGLK